MIMGGLQAAPSLTFGGSTGSARTWQASSISVGPPGPRLGGQLPPWGRSLEPRPHGGSAQLDTVIRPHPRPQLVDGAAVPVYRGWKLMVPQVGGATL